MLRHTINNDNGFNELVMLLPFCGFLCNYLSKLVIFVKLDNATLYTHKTLKEEYID